MTLSRTARILIALLLLAAAAFVWINFFAATPDTPGATAPGATTPGSVEGPSQPGDAAGDASGDPAGASDPDAATVLGAGPDTEADPDVDPEAGTPAGDADAPPTVVTEPSESVVGRDVVAAELPFLVTEPPAEGEDADAVSGEAALPGRPGASQRATVNPFSPIVVQAPPEAEQPAPAAAEADAPDVVDVAVPEAPEVETVVAEPPTPRAPAPSALAPSSPRAASLPRPLPSGTLPVAPSVLTSTRAEQAARTPQNVVGRAAVREPERTGAAPSFGLLGVDRTEAGADPSPLGPGDVPAAARSNRPLISGADELGRYLRDSNVSFTGSVVGSVGVGVFRVSGSGNPIVLALGQSLPETEIVLTDLRGQAAEFTLGDTTHVLNLDLRR